MVLEGINDICRQVVPILLRQEFVSRAGDREQLGLRRNELQCRCYFIDGAETVSRAMNKEGRSLEEREVRSAQLQWTLGRVQRIREQQETIDETGFGRGEHRCLPASVRMTAEKDAA